MKRATKTNPFERDSMILIGISLAVAFWFIESFMHIFLSPGFRFSDNFFSANQYDIYTRVIVLCLFLIFGSHVQYTINNRKKAEDALRESEEKYRSILESIEEGYYEVDLTGNFTFFNEALCRILDYSGRQLLGRNQTDFLDEKNSKIILTESEKVLKTGKPNSLFEVEYINRHGTARIVESSLALFRDTQNQPAGFRGVARDVTEKRSMERKLIEADRKLQTARGATILGLAKLAEYRDMDTGLHLERMREYSKLLAQALSDFPAYKGYITNEYIDDVFNSSILHDIGKVGIPDSILLKPARLTPEEFEIMKSHARLGGEAIELIESETKGQSFLTIGREIAFYHHEKWDGSGYPKGLRGEDIPLSARLIALADVYDALTSKRVYKEPLSHEEVKAMILEDKGKHFAPEVVDAFLAQEEKFKAVRLHMKDSEQAGLMHD